MKSLLTLILISISFSLSAAESDHSKIDHSKMGHSKHGDHSSHGDDHDHGTNEANIKSMTAGKVVIKVNGMVCSFCAQGVEKNFNKLDEVKSTHVDLDKMEVVVTYNKGKKLSLDKIKEVVTGAGFAFVKAK